MPNSDPARVVDVGEYGVLSDKRAGRNSGCTIPKRVKPSKQKAQYPEARAFPEAQDGRVRILPPNSKTQIEKAQSQDTTWSAEDIQILKLLWNGAIAANRIGKLLGKSRNAIANKAKRLTL